VLAATRPLRAGSRGASPAGLLAPVCQSACAGAENRAARAFDFFRRAMLRA
jgi:hypothetical protein